VEEGPKEGSGKNSKKRFELPCRRCRKISVPEVEREKQTLTKPGNQLSTHHLKPQSRSHVHADSRDDRSIGGPDRAGVSIGVVSLGTGAVRRIESGPRRQSTSGGLIKKSRRSPSILSSSLRPSRSERCIPIRGPTSPSPTPCGRYTRRVRWIIRLPPGRADARSRPCQSHDRQGN